MEGFSLDSKKKFDKVINVIDESSVVLLGEATHGTSEFYKYRSEISKQLIEKKKGFNFIAVEGDWPECYGVNQYVKGYSNSGKNMKSVLRKFKRWPTWMWANDEISSFGKWLKKYNKGKKEKVELLSLVISSFVPNSYTITSPSCFDSF